MTKSKKELREKLANIEHQRWADWQRWCHKVLRENCPSPELEKVLERWDKQIVTKYKDLSEKEKDSDRKQVDRYWPLIEKALQAKEEEMVGRVEKIKELIKTDGPWTSEYDGYDEAFDKGYNKCLEDVLSILKPNDGRCKCGNPKMDESDFCKDCI